MKGITERIREFRESLEEQRVIEVLRDLHSHLGSLDAEKQLLGIIESNIKMLRIKGGEVTFAELRGTNPKLYESYLSDIIRCFKEYDFNRLKWQEYLHGLSL